MVKELQVAVVEMGGGTVRVTVFGNKAAATVHALSTAQERTEKTVGGIADSLRLRGEFADGEYRIMVTPVRSTP